MKQELARLRHRKTMRMSLIQTRSTNPHETPRGISPREMAVNQVKSFAEGRSLSRKAMVQRYKPNSYEKPAKAKEGGRGKRGSVKFDEDFYEKELYGHNHLQPPSPYFGSLGLGK